MKVEGRVKARPEGKRPQYRGLVLIPETPEETELLDDLFGNIVGDDGVMGTATATYKLEDGYGQEYVYISKEGPDG